MSSNGSLRWRKLETHRRPHERGLKAQRLVRQVGVPGFVSRLTARKQDGRCLPAMSVRFRGRKPAGTPGEDGAALQHQPRAVGTGRGHVKCAIAIVRSSVISNSLQPHES